MARDPGKVPRRRRAAKGAPVSLGDAWPILLPGEAPGLFLPPGYQAGSEALLGPEGQIVTKTPLLPLAEILDVDTKEYHYEVHILSRDKERVEILPATALSDQRRVVELARIGVDVDSQTAPGLLRFLRAFRRANELPQRYQTRRLGWRPHTKGGTWLLDRCHPEDRPLIFLAETEDARKCLAGLRPAGTLAGWTELFLKCLPFPSVVTTLLAACLPPLREILDLPIPSFLLHLMAPTSTGKTLTQMAALSVWANPDSPAWLLHGHATYAGLEALCLRTYGLPVCIQDITLMPPDARRGLIYAVGNEAFKARGGERQRTQTPWHGVVITSGEEPLIHEASFGGEGARVLSLHGPPWGERSDATRSLLDTVLRPGLCQHHGTLGTALVNDLLGLDAAGREDLRRRWEELREEEAAAAGGSHLLARQAGQWAGLRLTAIIVEGLLSAGRLPALHEAVLKTREAAKAQEPPHPTRRAQELLVGEVYANEAYCYRMGPSGYEKPKREGRLVGAINEEAGTVALFRQIVEDLLRRHGFPSPTATLEAMRADELLVTDRGHLTSMVQCGGQRRRMVVIRLPDRKTDEDLEFP